MDGGREWRSEDGRAREEEQCHPVVQREAAALRAPLSVSLITSVILAHLCWFCMLTKIAAHSQPREPKADAAAPFIPQRLAEKTQSLKRWTYGPP